MSRYTRTIVELFEEYAEKAGPGPVDLNHVAEWAMSENRWRPQPGLARKKLVEELGRALRDDVITDANGRRVRAKHSAWVKNGDVTLHLWDDIRRAGHEHMERSFTQRRNMIVDDCTQLKSDVDAYNAYRPERPAIQLVLDFTPDIAEREALDQLRKKKAETPAHQKKPTRSRNGRTQAQPPVTYRPPRGAPGIVVGSIAPTGPNNGGNDGQR